MLNEVELTKIMLVGVRVYLNSLVKQIQESDNPKLSMYANYNLVGEVLTFFDKDPELEEFIREIGYNRDFMEMFRTVSDTIYLFNKLGEEDEN